MVVNWNLRLSLSSCSRLDRFYGNRLKGAVDSFLMVPVAISDHCKVVAKVAV